MDDVFIHILAGGSGERFWPLSRKVKPKQLLRLFGPHTLLETTLQRVQPLCQNQPAAILTNQAQVDSIHRECPNLGPVLILGEPAKRDTAPAAALATARAYAQDPDAIVVLLPSDQLIQDAEGFRRDLQTAIQHAREHEALVTLGIQPDHPATGFGYMELATDSDPRPGHVNPVLRFVEKPDLPTAQHYLASGRHLWNAGIFIWKARVFTELCRTLAPELHHFILQFPAQPDDVEPYLQKNFPLLPKISVDYAILEKAPQVASVRACFDWDDVGSWTALAAHLPSDQAENILPLKSASLNSQRNLVHSATDRHIALCGVSDLVVVDTGDALLICHRDKVQEVKNLLPSLPPRTALTAFLLELFLPIARNKSSDE
ncbi:MAG: mannose-1-phosphate guanylyltransferase [Blastochloris sp.]|nr:mannose-1-phosphate guanylyltransferase [Blastochloris sp.]